ncbi:hypothetical protein [Subtercola sp. YIM 133946]|uniref:hypothetical protein n=1 Tax=Subtercola sp. YIM 133946 TaxID=3118909 RepID=UPI002F936BE4
MRSIVVGFRAESRGLWFRNHRGSVIDVCVAPGRPAAGGGGAIGTVLGSGTLIGYVSRAARDSGVRLVILTVLSDSGEAVAGPMLSATLDDDEAHLIMRAAAENDDPVRALRHFVTFRPERCPLSSAAAEP